MVCVGVDVAKGKHDCFILSSEGEVLADVFAIPNSIDGFQLLVQPEQVRHVRWKKSPVIRSVAHASSSSERQSNTQKASLPSSSMRSWMAIVKVSNRWLSYTGRIFSPSMGSEMGACSAKRT